MTFDIVTQALSEHRSIDAVFKLFKYEFDCNPSKNASFLLFTIFQKFSNRNPL